MEQAKLKDVLEYTPESYYTTGELELIKRTFKGNSELFRILRKTLLPSVADPNLPMEEFAKDAYLAGKSWATIPEKERATLIVARQEAIEFVLGGLIYLKNLASIKEESLEEMVARRKKDSTK